MKIDELFPHTFKALRHELGHDRARDTRPMWQRRLSADSDFCRAMVGCGYLTQEQMLRAVLRYRLGMSRDGGVIFWQIDMLGQIFDGKIMHYRPDGHRDHDRKPYWVSHALKHHYLKDDPQIAAGIPSHHCLFGTHLISPPESGGVRGGLNKRYFRPPLTPPRSALPLGSSKNLGGETPVAVVEAEKTAVILSELYPGCLWLAAGGLYELTAVKLFPLRGRRIILFPDTDTDGKAFSTWYRVTLEAQRLLGQTIHLSSLLEQKATPDQKRRKIDLVDFLEESRCFSDIRT